MYFNKYTLYFYLNQCKKNLPKVVNYLLLKLFVILSLLLSIKNIFFKFFVIIFNYYFLYFYHMALDKKIKSGGE